MLGGLKLTGILTVDFGGHAAQDASAAARRVQALEAALRAKEEAEARAAGEREALVVSQSVCWIFVYVVSQILTRFYIHTLP